MEKEITCEILNERPGRRSILLYGIEEDPTIGRMLTLKEETDEEGKIWIVTSDSQKSVTMELGEPLKGLLNTLTPEEHRETIMEMSINKWIKENGS